MDCGSRLPLCCHSLLWSLALIRQQADEGKRQRAAAVQGAHYSASFSKTRPAAIMPKTAVTWVAVPWWIGWVLHAACPRFAPGCGGKSMATPRIHRREDLRSWRWWEVALLVEVPPAHSEIPYASAAGPRMAACAASQ